MRWSRTSPLLLAISLLGTPLIGRSQWVAYNDHAAGATTAANATRWNVFHTAGGAPGASGFLKNIVTGTNLPVTLTLATNAGVTPAGTQGAPAAGTPVFNVFNVFVDFQGAPSPSVELSGTALVTYTFSGLDPAKRYNFKGTAVRGNAAYVDRWTLVEIADALSFTAAHTAHVLTSSQVPALTTSQCAINTGVNNDVNSGDYASWDNIQPSAGGVIAITSRQYTGTVPGGSSAGTRGYAITGIRLEELGTGVTPIQIISQPQNQNVAAGASATLSVSVNGSSPSYQWYKEGVLLPTKTNQSLTFNPVSFSDGGVYYVNITNSVSSTNSANATLTVFLPSIVYTNIALTNATFPNALWKYNQAGSTPANETGGRTWKESGYNDAAWPSGRGILAVEDNTAITPRTNTVLSLTDGGGNRIITYYFRNTFVLTNDPSTVTLVMSNIVDDGAIMYLNGTEVRRFNMPNGTVIYSTLASSAATENVFTWTNLPASLLIQGTNTIAVEVHQNSATSSDVVFGMEITTLIPPPSALSIVSQPQSLAVEERKDAVFTVGILGGDPHIQWYKDGVALSNEIRTTLTVPLVTTNESGIYVVVITNIVNSVTSNPALLVVYPDTNAPVLLQADGTQSLTNVLVSFSERLLSTQATNTGNYTVTNTQGGTLAVSRATLLANGTNVMLQTAARTSGSNYLLYVRNVRDLSAAGNVIAANSATPIIQLVNLVTLNSGYRYYNPVPFFGDDPVLPATWKDPSYNDGGAPWGNGTSIFFDGADESVVPGTVGTHLTQSDAYISYFRTLFNQGVSPGGLTLEMSHVVDDGAVFYLNGTEIYRFNMPDGPIAYNTPANFTVGNPARVTVNVPGSLVVTGENVLAVSLHQAASVDLDATFGVELVGRAQSYIVGPVLIARNPLDVTIPEGQRATFDVASVGGFRFQWQSNGVVIAGATNTSYTTQPVTTNMNGTLYRIGVSNATSGLLSGAATLRVVADTNAPAIVSAYISSNNTIVVSFTEPMNPASAQTLANYFTTNAAGGVTTLTGATLSNGTNVILSYSTTLAGRYTIVVNNVTDASSGANRIAANSTVTVGANYTIAMTSAWKYLLINTNDAVQETYYELSYDDSSWSGPSNALMYVEGAALPFAKNTLLSLTDGGGNVINTFYFRQKLVAPIGSTNITLRIRHVIDDGMVLYLNGREIYRYKMPAGTITASSQASAPAIGDASLLGPFDVTVTNLIGGTNLFAAEVHQNGAASSDVVFGLEVTATIPSVVVVPTNSPVVILVQPQSRTNAVGTTASFSVTASGTSPQFQWRSNNVAIASATNSTLNVANVQLSDSGKAFTVVITNSFNSVTSLVATLTVTNVPPQCLAISWTNNLRLSLTVTNGTNIAIVWSNPATNTCGSNAVVVLQRALALSPAPSQTLWTNIFTNTFGSARVVVTNGAVGSATNTARFYKLRVGGQ